MFYVLLRLGFPCSISIFKLASLKEIEVVLEITETAYVHIYFHKVQLRLVGHIGFESEYRHIYDESQF